MRGSFRTDNTAAIHVAVCHGLGIGYGPFWQIRDLLDRGALEIVLEDFRSPALSGLRGVSAERDAAGQDTPVVDRWPRG